MTAMALPLVTPHTNPQRSLIVLFTAWKTLLLAIALGAASFSPGYDTSTDLFFAHVGDAEKTAAASAAAEGTPLLVRQLTRWDALYFVHAAASRYGGKVYEQEYAFSTGLSSLLNLLARLFSFIFLRDTEEAASPPPAYLHALAGILVSHIAHLISVLALYRLTCVVFQPTHPVHWIKKRSVVRIYAFTAAALHIFSPAGVFLSSPYAEAPYSCLSIVGNYIFARAYLTPELFTDATARLLRRYRDVVLAGGLLGLATWFRSNGLASGLLFAVEALRCFRRMFTHPGMWPVVGLASAILGGIFVGMGSFVPQFLAWERYCGTPADAGLPTRPWCEEMVPSIYSFVQEHYWDVGFLRYWTPNQIPLFILAAPVLSLLIISGLHFLFPPSPNPPPSLYSTAPAVDSRFSLFVRTSAAIQTTVALLALTSYHVQIISRLASGYFVWYWWVAGCLVDPERKDRRKIGWGIAVFMVMYAAIQGALYASFLPPA